jgi:ligand-binding SRPBCC domain-containing protein
VGEFRLERVQTIPTGVEEVFGFFSDPRNLGIITPPWLQLRVVSTSTELIGEGTTIDYRLRIRGIPIHWRSLIRAFDPPRRFVDEQVLGPYRTWVHEHRFEELGGNTRVEDKVSYSVLGGALVNRFLVRPDLERIFDYRTEHLERVFAILTP